METFSNWDEHNSAVSHTHNPSPFVKGAAVLTLHGVTAVFLPSPVCESDAESAERGGDGSDVLTAVGCSDTSASEFFMHVCSVTATLMSVPCMSGYLYKVHLGEPLQLPPACV